MNKYSPEMRAELRLMCTPIDVLVRSFEEGISETVVIGSRGLRGVDTLSNEWEALNRVMTAFNRTANPGELKRFQVHR